MGLSDKTGINTIKYYINTDYDYARARHILGKYKIEVFRGKGPW